jgi:hypothetical protein
MRDAMTLHIRNVSKTYSNGVQALKDVSPTNADLRVEIYPDEPAVDMRGSYLLGTAGSQYELTLDVVARKMRADSVGHETETPMDDFVEIGVFGPGTREGLGTPLYLRRHRIRTGTQTFRVTVPREPVRAGIDPSRELIEREREDNVVEVTVQSAAAS